MPGPYPLITLAPAIDRYGVTTVAFEDMLASLRASYQQIYGSDVYLEPDSQDGQWLAVQAQAFYDLGQAIANVYFGYNPHWAQGEALSSVVKINGLQRQIATQSRAELTLIGEANTTILNGVVADTISGGLWDLPDTVVIPPNGEITVTATAREAGQLLAPPNTITEIRTFIAGWQSVTNAVAAQAGVPVETDAQLRRRQHRSTGLPAITPIGGLYGMLANIPGVGRVEVYENDRDYIDRRGVPAHSIAAVLDGGDATAIAEVIARKKNPGTGTHGPVVVEVRDQAAMPLRVHFFYTEWIEIFVEITLIPQRGFATATTDLIRQAVAHFINDLRTGHHIYRSWLAAPASLAGDAAIVATGRSSVDLEQLAETYVLTQLRVGTSPQTLGTADIELHFAQSAMTQLPDIGIIIQQ